MILMILLALLLTVVVILGGFWLRDRLDRVAAAEMNPSSALESKLKNAMGLAERLSRVYGNLANGVPGKIPRPGDALMAPYRRSLGAQASIRALAAFLDPSNTDPRIFPSAELQRDYMNLVQDALELRDALPFKAELRYGLYDEARVHFDPRGCFSPELFDPWLKRLEQLVKLTEEFQRDVAEYHRLGSAALLSRGFNYGGGRSGELPSVSTEGLTEHGKAVLEESLRSLPRLPLVERERAKRALGTISEAQRLKQEVQEKEGITIEGKSPDEVVSEIISRSLVQLEQAEKNTARSPEDALAVLSIYSRSLEE